MNRKVAIALVLVLCASQAAYAAPGHLISATQITGPPHAKAWKIVYESTSLAGVPRTVSGLVIVPEGAAPPGGRNVVSWAHPTTGIAERCAPSASRSRFISIPGLASLIDRGYVIAATDYPGLGTPGMHPYLVGVSEARAVIDAVRAADALPQANASKRYVAWGHSQGGQAALFVAEIATAYAPDLELKGAAAIAPPTDLEENLRNIITTVPGRLLASYTLVSWSNVYSAPLDRVTRHRAIPIVRLVGRQCAATRFEASRVMFTAKLLTPKMLLPAFWTSEPWLGSARKNSADPSRIGAPLLVVQGTKDPVVTPAITEGFVGSACASGKRVDLVRIDGGGHFFAGFDSAGIASAWFAQRFAQTANSMRTCTVRDVPVPSPPKL